MYWHIPHVKSKSQRRRRTSNKTTLCCSPKDSLLLHINLAVAVAVSITAALAIDQPWRK